MKSTCGPVDGGRQLLVVHKAAIHLRALKYTVSQRGRRRRGHRAQTGHERSRCCPRTFSRRLLRRGRHTAMELLRAVNHRTIRP